MRVTTASIKTRLINTFRPAVNALLEQKALRGVPNKPLVRALLKQEVWPDGEHYDAATQRLYIKEWDSTVTQSSFGWSVERSGLKIQLDSEQGFLWATDVLGKNLLPQTTRNQQSARARWRAETHGFHFYLETVCDLDIAREVFIEGEYDWLIQQFTPGSVVWDIGMNIGTASLLFASQANVDRVYGFEPVAHTFGIASHSIAENTPLNLKIAPENAGIAGSERAEQFDYTPNSKAGTGLVGILPTTLDHYDIHPSDIEKVNVHLKDAASILRRIRAENLGAPIYLKCDCEGAEYEIVDRLIEADVIAEISAAVIECHKGDPKRLAGQLNTAGFATRLDTKVDGLFYHVSASRNAVALGAPPVASPGINYSYPSN